MHCRAPTMEQPEVSICAKKEKPPISVRKSGAFLGAGMRNSAEQACFYENCSLKPGVLDKCLPKKNC